MISQRQKDAVLKRLEQIATTYSKSGFIAEIEFKESEVTATFREINGNISYNIVCNIPYDDIMLREAMDEE